MSNNGWTQEHKYAARCFLKAEIQCLDGIAFQRLLWAILSRHHTNFTPINQAAGDGGNDGYCRDTGTYYQCSAPEEPNKPLTRADVAKKVEEDFLKIRENWNDTLPIKEYKFAFNDKFRGVGLEISQKLDQMTTNHSIPCNLMLPRHLVDICLNLPFDQFLNLDIIPWILDPNEIRPIEFSPLHDVIRHVISSPQLITRFGNLTTPALDEKIKLNGLGSQESVLLRHAAYQVGEIDVYFDRNSHFDKQAVRDYFATNYEQLKSQYIDKKTQKPDNNEIFWILLHGIMPSHLKNQGEENNNNHPGKKRRKSKKNEPGQLFSEADLNGLPPKSIEQSRDIFRTYQEAAIVLMAYYFESCDWGITPSVTP